MTEPAGRAATAPPQSLWLFSLPFWLLLLIFEAFVFSLPLFPTGDSGLHIYYATIFRDLITHRSALYAHFYAVRHLVQPYLLHYWVFIGLCSFLSPDMAEKVIVGIVMATMAFGFRNLIRALSPASPGLVLLIFPFMLNWPLSMGALNYDFALGLLFFALGAYERLLRPGRSAPRLWRFAGLLLLFVLSHPVPLLLLVCILAVDLLLAWWENGFARTVPPALRPRLLAFGLSCVAFLVPLAIADKGEVGKSVSQIGIHWDYFKQVSNSSRLTMFFASGIPGRLYNKCYTILLPASLVFIYLSGFPARLRRRALTSFDRLAIFAVLFLFTSLFAPFELNGSGYFAPRLWMPCWLLGIAACSGALHGRKWNRVAAIYGIVLSLITLGMAQHILRPIAVRSAEIEHAPLPVGQRGLFVQGISGEKGDLIGVTYPVYWWNGGRAFITHNDVMLNSAWLYLTIIPLKENGTAGLMRDFTARRATENPNEVDFYFSQNPGERGRALANADFIFFVDPRPKNPDVGAVMRLTIEPYMNEWNCNVSGFYAICKKKAPIGSL